MNYQHQNSTSTEIKQSSQNIIQVKCIGNNQAKLICLTEECKSANIFTCFNQQCQCYLHHQKCCKGSVHYALKKLQTKILSTQQINTQILHTFNSIIDKFNALRDQLIKIMQTKIQFTPLSHMQKIFLNVILKNQDTQLFSPVQAKILWKDIDCQSHNKIQILQCFKNQLKNYKTKQKQNFQIMNKYLQNLQLNFQEQDKKLQRMRRKLKSQQIDICKHIVSTSSIVRSQLLCQKLIKMFNKKIRKIDVLFKASQNKFKIKKYFQICGSVLNSVIICQTNKGMIIGGYTPLFHQSDQEGYTEDTTSTSFLFSLTNDDKFELRNQEQAIDRYKSKSCICFGDSQFVICDQANTNKNCITNINWNYSNCNYKDDNQASYLKLNGNQSEYFTVNQWQVWKIEFAE